MGRLRMFAGFEAAETKWKKMFSGHEECWRTERTAAMEPRR